MRQPRLNGRPNFRHLHVVIGGGLWLGLLGASVHCSSDEQGASGSSNGNGGGASTGKGAGPTGTGGEIDFDAGILDYSAEQIFQNDPPPMSCDGGGMAPPNPGGTPECPNDKNLPGCECTTPGQMAACWTGLRKNRNHGICKDGMTTCVLKGEVGLVWDDCKGEVLPVPNATNPKQECLCFSGGHWQIDNTEPCFFFSDQTQTNVIATVSTVVVNGTPQCPSDPSSPPAEPWSTDSLTVDCSGYFKLCYTLKAGNGASPQPSDCVITQQCTEGYYSPANSKVSLPPLNSWLANDPQSIACAKQFVQSGGYGEMSVVGQSDECDKVDKVFQHVTYCPLSCNTNPNTPQCMNCMPGGGGNF